MVLISAMFRINCLIHCKLEAEADKSGQNNVLIFAGINQKIEELKPIPFTAAIDLNKNRRYFKYAAIPMAILLVVLFAAPSLLFDGSERLIKHSTAFEVPAPFSFNVENKDLKAVRAKISGWL